MNGDIKLSLPASAEYMLAVRLFLSGVAERMGCDINVIEDIKTAVSEACVLLMSGADGGRLDFAVSADDRLEAHVEINDFSAGKEGSDTELSRLILTSIADETDISETADGKVTAVEFVFKGQE